MMSWLDPTRSILLDPNDPDLGDRTYHIPCYASLDTLVRSIERIGIINRPLVQEMPGGKMVLVLGRRRIEAARKVGLKAVQVRIVPREMPEADGFLLAFWDNIGQRFFDVATQAVVVRRLLEIFQRSTVATEFLPVLGIAAKGPRLESLRAIGGLEDPVLASLASGRILEKTAEILARLDRKERMICMSLMNQLGMNANKNAELVVNLFDLSVFHHKPISKIISVSDAVALLENELWSAPEKASRFRELVRSWKFPELVKDEKNFRDWQRRMSLPKQITIRHAQSFENHSCTIEIRSDSRDEANKILARLLNEA